MMRRSFGGGSRGMGGGGGSSSSGGMLRTVQRALKTGPTIGGAAQEPFSHSTTTSTAKTATTTTSTTKHTFNNKPNTTLSLSSSSSPLSSNLPPINAAVFAPSWDSSSYNTEEGDDWECLDGCDQDERVNIFFDDYNNILGPVPSTDEVHHAVSALQQVLEPSYYSYYNDGNGYNSNEGTADELTSSVNLTRQLSSSGSVSDWIEPSMHICNSKLLQSYGSNRVYDAFHLLQTEPSIRKMVISLSSDKAVWDAVLNNEAVREIRDSLKQVDAADNSLPGSTDGASDKSDSDGTIDIISWIVVNTKEKVMEMVEKIIEFVNEWFQPPEEETSDSITDPFAEKLKTSFFLLVVVLLVVVVARAQNA